MVRRMLSGITGRNLPGPVVLAVENYRIIHRRRWPVGPFNMPVQVRAALNEAPGPVAAEARLVNLRAAGCPLLCPTRVRVWSTKPR